jgi:hypothetical protein
MRRSLCDIEHEAAVLSHLRAFHGYAGVCCYGSCCSTETPQLHIAAFIGSTAPTIDRAMRCASSMSPTYRSTTSLVTSA